MLVAVTVYVEQSMTSAVPMSSCPKCGSTNVQSVPVKRSSVPELQAAEYLRSTANPQSVDTIFQGACSRCGCRWIPRTTEERRLRALSGQLGAAAARTAESGHTLSRTKERLWRVLPKGRNRALIVLLVLLAIWVIGLLI